MIKIKNLQWEMEFIILKKLYKIYFYIFKQIIPQNDKDRKYYGKDYNYDKQVRNLIKNNSTITRSGINSYTNGNVNVIIPCASNF